KKPAYRNQLAAALAEAFEVIQYSLVRHPADQWLSTARLKVMEDHLDLEAFLAGHRRFSEQAVTLGFMRYEDFTRDPAKHMQLLCEHLQTGYDAGFINRWQNNEHVTGDISRMSRGSGFNDIKPLERRPVDKSLLKALQNNPDYYRSLELLGYTDPLIRN
ncbi:MAG: sulfotransferase, partial [Gammaproteobacteria bacterium]|nr:sulfotransferase [Gammaproteobacteria bacterium]